MSQHDLDAWQWRDRLRARIDLRPGREDLALAEAGGRVLTEDVRSPEDLPVVAISAMDGFAVRREDLGADGHATLPVVADLPARSGAPTALPAGTAMRIMTGAPVPAGADAVIEVEATDADPFGPAPSAVALGPAALPPTGRHIRRRGEEVARGDLLAEAGERVGPGLLGMAATLGLPTLPVRAAIRVAVVVTGDELASVPHPAADTGPGTGPAAAGPDAPVAHGMVRESNGLMLATALRAEGAQVRTLRSGDDPAQLHQVLADAATGSDLVLTTGGIGQGAFDVVRAALGETGTGTSQFVHLALRPGAPQGAGTLPDGTPVIHLPGTPVGALVGFHLFVRPLLGGARVEPHRLLLAGPVEPARSRKQRGVLIAQPGRLGVDADGVLRVRVLAGHRLTPYARADALVLREDGSVAADALVVPF